MKVEKENKVHRYRKRIIEQKSQINDNSNEKMDSAKATPKQSPLFNKIQQCVEQKLQVEEPYHKRIIREKLTNGIKSKVPSDSSSSFNIWDNNQEDDRERNLFSLYEERYNQISDKQIKPEQVVRNIKELMGLNLRVKNLNKYPWFTYHLRQKNEQQQQQQQQQQKYSKITNYYLPMQKDQFKTKTKFSSRQEQIQSISDKLRQLNSPEILKMKFYR